MINVMNVLVRGDSYEEDFELFEGVTVRIKSLTNAEINESRCIVTKGFLFNSTGNSVNNISTEALLNNEKLYARYILKKGLVSPQLSDKDIDNMDTTFKDMIVNQINKISTTNEDIIKKVKEFRPE